jgi:hypothetical protein
MYGCLYPESSPNKQKESMRTWRRRKETLGVLGEYAKSVYISVNNNTNFNFFKESFYLHYMELIKPKTISRYCPFQSGRTSFCSDSPVIHILLKHHICVHNAYHSSAGYDCNWHYNRIASGGYDNIVAEPGEPKIHPFYGCQKLKMGYFFTELFSFPAILNLFFKKRITPKISNISKAILR